MRCHIRIHNRQCRNKAVHGLPLCRKHWDMTDRTLAARLRMAYQTYGPNASATVLYERQLIEDVERRLTTL